MAASFAPRMSRAKSYHVPPPVQLIKHDGDRMTMKGEYGTPVDEEVTIHKEDRDKLEIQLAKKGREGGWGDVVPVWVGDDENGAMKLRGVDRWRNYAERGKLAFMILLV